MSLCSACGLERQDGEALCPQHHLVTDDWARGNKLLCDWLHRGKEPTRLPLSDRNDVLLPWNLPT